MSESVGHYGSEFQSEVLYLEALARVRKLSGGCVSGRGAEPVLDILQCAAYAQLFTLVTRRLLDYAPDGFETCDVGRCYHSTHQDRRYVSYEHKAYLLVEPGPRYFSIGTAGADDYDPPRRVCKIALDAEGVFQRFDRYNVFVCLRLKAEDLGARDFAESLQQIAESLQERWL